jgi:hypothetical protein
LSSTLAQTICSSNPGTKIFEPRIIGYSFIEVFSSNLSFSKPSVFIVILSHIFAVSFLSVASSNFANFFSISSIAPSISFLLTVIFCFSNFISLYFLSISIFGNTSI